MKVPKTKKTGSDIAPAQGHLKLSVQPQDLFNDTPALRGKNVFNKLKETKLSRRWWHEILLIEGLKMLSGKR